MSLLLRFLTCRCAAAERRFVPQADLRIAAKQFTGLQSDHSGSLQVDYQLRCGESATSVAILAVANREGLVIECQEYTERKRP